MKEAINPFEELMIRVLDGYATEAEQKQLDSWLTESPANQATFEEFQKIWTSASDVNSLKNLDIEADLIAVKQLATVEKKVIKASGISTSAKITSFSYIRRIAAVLLPLVVVAAALFFYFNQTINHEPILLSDGTKVWLHNNAKLNYTEHFSGEARLVQLEGEAYFEVAKDTLMPFIIETETAKIEVLGTSFNVQSETRKTNVIVNTGKVRLSSNEASEQMVELTKGEKGIYQNDILSKTQNTDKNYRAWQNGIFEFDGTLPINDVITQLSKYYGRISINTATNPTCSLIATFEQEELNTILETINKSCGY